MSVFSIAPIEPPDTAMAPPSRVATVLELKKKVYCINRSIENREEKLKAVSNTVWVCWKAMI